MVSYERQRHVDDDVTSPSASQAADESRGEDHVIMRQQRKISGDHVIDVESVGEYEDEDTKNIEVTKEGNV